MPGVGCADSEDCVETFSIGDSSYVVPPKWCGHKLDSSEIADKSKLVQLDSSLTFEDYRIYLMPLARDAFEQMATRAKKDSVYLIVDSGFRSSGFQSRIIQRRLEVGEKIEQIVNMVAPPGYSQHETGLAVDLVPSEARFYHTVEYKWLKENGEHFGFIESYPENNPDSLDWESWHWLFIGQND